MNIPKTGYTQHVSLSMTSKAHAVDPRRPGYSLCGRKLVEVTKVPFSNDSDACQRCSSAKIKEER